MYRHAIVFPPSHRNPLRKWMAYLLVLMVGRTLLEMQCHFCGETGERSSHKASSSKITIATDTNDDRTIQILNMTSYRKATLTKFNKTYYPGCGFTVKLDLGRARILKNDDIVNETSHQHNSFNTTTAFFKVVQPSDPNFHFNEWHLREILSSYLDDMVATNVVPRTVGYRISLGVLSEQFSEVTEHANCILGDMEEAEALWRASVAGDNATTKQQSILASPTHNVTPISGSLMQWTTGIKEASHFEIQTSAKGVQGSNRTTRIQDSAVRYSVFYWLAGCWKSYHNHFVRSKGFHREYVAIDNDRCFMPPNVTYFASHKNSHWNYLKQQATLHSFQELVLETIECQHFPYEIVLNVLRLTSGKNTPSQALLAAMQQDALAEELLAFPPETIVAMDTRIQMLGERLRQCGYQSEEENWTRDTINESSTVK